MKRLWGISGLLLAVFFLHACASGSYIVIGEVREPTDMELVKLYVEPPDEYEIIGIVKASSDAGWTEQGSQDYAVKELKKQAAKLGANGIILTTTGENVSSVIGTSGDSGFYAIPVTAQQVSGKAIFVQGNASNKAKQ